MNGVRNNLFKGLILKLLFEKSGNMFEMMEISETIYEGVV